MTDTGCEWAEKTIAGYRALGSSRHTEAAGHWLAAAALLSSAAAHDPRRAAAKTNLGVAHVLLGQVRKAEILLAGAELGWVGYARHVETADVPLAGRSSSFHFRLASRNLAAFQAIERRRLAHYCQAGLAITRFNRLLSSAGAVASAATSLTLASLLSDVLGPRSLEVRLLTASSQPPASKTDPADSLYAEKAAELSVSCAAASWDETDGLKGLELAVQLTVLLRPSYLHDAGIKSRTMPNDDLVSASTASSSTR